MAPHTEASLKKLTVVQLKDLLTNLSLPTTGKKDELIARLIEAKADDGEGASSTTETTTSADTAPSTSTTTAGATDSTSTPATAPAASTDAAATTTKPEAPKVPELTEEEKAERAKIEEQKRQARAARFGVSVTSSAAPAEVAGGEDKLNERAKRFGLEGEKKVEGEKALEKSLSALDRPLGEKKQRPPKPTKAPVDLDKPSSTGKAPAAPAKKEIDPEMAKKIAEEDERKRKRAERFGVPAPAEKKAKVT